MAKAEPVTKVYRGWLKKFDNGEDDRLLTITGLSTIRALADEIQDDIAEHGRFLSVRYFITDKEVPAESIEEAFLKKLYGAGDADYGNNYSEMTGYLWTDEDIQVGGHDLLAELKANIEKFCHMEITYHKKDKPA